MTANSRAPFMQNEDDQTLDNSAANLSVDIGAAFRQAREAMQADIDEAARTTKLSCAVIEHIEKNEFTEVGTAVYVRGYLGIYAKYLGLNASEYIALYDAQYPQENIALRPSVAHSLDSDRKKIKRHSKTLSFIAAFCAFIGMTYLYLAFLEPILFASKTSSQGGQVTQLSDSASTQNPNEGERGDSGVDAVVDTNRDGADNAEAGNLDGDASIEDLISAADQANTLANDVLEGVENNASGQSNNANPITLESAGAIAGENTASENTDSADADLVADTPNDESTNVQGEQAESETPQTGALKITFNQDAWIQIKDATGTNLAINTYGRNRPIDVTGELPFTINLARPEAIEEILFNDNAIELQSFKTGNIQYEISGIDN